jgi:hypothetical protein
MEQRKLMFLIALFAVGPSLVVTGCSKKEEPKASVSQPAPQQAPAQQPVPAATQQAPSQQPVQPAAQQSPQPTTQPAASPAPVPSTMAALASADGEKQGLRVEVTELKRTSVGTLNLKFVMINDSDTKLELYKQDFGDDWATISGVTLVDEKNKKKYFVVRDSEKKCLCSSGLNNLPSKDRINLWAKFPAPPEDVQKISVVAPHFQPMDDVSISR